MKLIQLTDIHLSAPGQTISGRDPNANFDRALAIVREVADNYPVTLVNSLNPYRLQGQKTAAFEVVDALGEAPDWLCIPMGNAGNISAYWMGFQEYRKAGHSQRLPRMMGFQASGSAPLVLGHTVEQPDTIATAIRIGNPVNKERALKARSERATAISWLSPTPRSSRPTSCWAVVRACSASPPVPPPWPA